MATIYLVAALLYELYDVIAKLCFDNLGDLLGLVPVEGPGRKLGGLGAFAF